MLLLGIGVLLLCCVIFVWYVVEHCRKLSPKISTVEALKLAGICALIRFLTKTAAKLSNKLNRNLYVAAHWLDLPIVKLNRIIISGVPVFQIVPEKKESKHWKCVIFIHGGGFVYPHTLMYRVALKHISEWTECMILSIDYRLAPNYKYPAAHDDCYHVTKHILTHAQEMNIDPKNIVLCGDSAGGNLVASTSLRLCEESFPYKPKAQVLICPWIQNIDFTFPSYANFENWFVLMPKDVVQDFAIAYVCQSEKDQNLFKEVDKLSCKLDRKISMLQRNGLTNVRPSHKETSKYNLPQEKEENNTFLTSLCDPYLFPLMCDRLPVDYPVVTILNCEFDILRDENQLFYNQLIHEGHKPNLFTYTTTHCGFLFPTKEGYRMKKDIANIISNIFQQ